MQSEHEDQLKSLQENKESHNDTLKETYEQRISELETAIATAVDEKKREIDGLKSKYDSDIELAESNKKKALELAKKVKEAASMQMKKSTECLKEEHSKEISKLSSDHESNVKKLKEKYKEDIMILQNQNDSDKRLTEEVEELTKKHNIVVKSLEEEKESQLNNIKKTHEEELERMQKASSEEKQKLVEANEVAAADRDKSKVILQQKMAKHAEDLKAYYEGKMKKIKDEHDVSRTKWEAEATISFEKKLSELQMLCTSVTEDKQALQEKLRSQITSELSIQKEVETLRKELKESTSKHESESSSMTNEQNKLKAENAAMKNEVDVSQKDLASKKNQIEEITGQLNSLKENLNLIAEEKKDIERKMEAVTKQLVKLNVTQNELVAAREEVNALKLEQTQSSGLVSRLKTEKDASEKKHGQHTALVGMLEAQLAELNESNAKSQAELEGAIYDMSLKDDELNSLTEQLEKTQKKLSFQEQASRKLSAEQAAQTVDKDILKKAKMTETLQREMQSLQQQMARKSASAQKLIQERESECKELRKRNKQLSQELDKGSFTDRRIFELAAQQSSRECMAASEIDVRNQIVQRLTDKLASRDGELASAEYTNHKIEDQVEELCKMQRREDVNIDYLKSIIVQYLSKPPGSSERNALLPVIATLLQFTDSDYKMIENGKSKLDWFGSIMPTHINSPGGQKLEIDQQAAPLLTSSSASSAEITVSTSNISAKKDRTTRTSLQF